MKEGKLMDATQGRKTRSAIQAETMTISQRLGEGIVG